jgi:hypothetical protein
MGAFGETIDHLIVQQFIVDNSSQWECRSLVRLRVGHPVHTVTKRVGVYAHWWLTVPELEVLSYLEVISPSFFIYTLLTRSELQLIPKSVEPSHSVAQCNSLG